MSIPSRSKKTFMTIRNCHLCSIPILTMKVGEQLRVGIVLVDDVVHERVGHGEDQDDRAGQARERCLRDADEVLFHERSR